MATILVIDDAEEIRARIRKLLTYEGYDIIEAANGQNGVQLAREHQPDIIICDIIMPGMSGYHVLSELRSDPATAAIPCIFLSAQTARQNVRRGMNVGADDYLTKPFEVDELLAAITTRLEKQAVVKKQMDELRINLRSILPREIWTPLADITAFSEFLTNETLLPEPREVAAIGSIIHDTSLHLQHLVENYLLYAQLKLIECDPDGREQWPPDERIATKKFITFLAENQAECMDRRDDLVLDLIDATIQIAPRSLQEIITELLDNAFKFSEPGTHIHLVSYSDGDQFVLRVTDHGQGMAAKEVTGIETCGHVKHLWDDQQEPGFGLRICRLLVQLHGGTLTIASAPGKGTAVTIKFNR